MPNASSFIQAAEVHDGDLLFSRKNTYEYVGMSAMVKKTPVNLMLPDLIFRLNTKPECHKVYLWQLINHTLFRPSIKVLASGSTGSMPNISKQRLAELCIPLPPIDLQNQFASFIEQVDKSKFELQQTLDKLNTTITMLMQ